MHPFITILGHRFLAYDLLGIIGTALAVLCFYHYLAQIPIKKNQLIIAMAVSLVVEHYGAQVIPFFYRIIYLHQDPKLFFFKYSPGQYFHSIFISMLLYWVLVSNLLRWPVWKVLDGFMLVLFMSTPIGRVGCLLQGCCLGKPASLPWAIRISTYPGVPGIPRHPVQAYMAILETILIVFLWYFYKKRKKYDGQTFWLSCLLYSVYRFFIEFLRTNPPAAFGYSHAQLFSAALIVVSAIALISHKKNPLSTT